MRGTTTLSRRRRHFRGRVAALLGSAAAAAGTGVGHDCPAGAAVYTYAGPFTGTGYFSNGSSWVGGVAPVSDPSTQLVFNNVGSTGYNAVTNGSSGTPFLLNAVTVNNFGTGTVDVNGTGSTGPLEFNGTSGATFNINGSGNANLDDGTNGTILDTTLTIGGSGNGILQIGGGASSTAISGTGGLALNLTGLGQVSLQGSGNNFSSGVTLNSGSLSLVGSVLPTMGALTINGGTLRATGTVANAVTLGADLFQTNGAVAFSGVISNSATGSGGIHLVNGLNPTYTNIATTSVTLNNNNTFSGPVTIDSTPIAANLSASPTGSSFYFSTVSVSGTGNLGNTSAVTVGNNGTLNFTGSTANTRVPDSATVALNGGRLSLTLLTTSVAFTETFGTVSASGSNTFSIGSTQTSGTAVNDVLTFGTFTQANNGTLFFQGQWLGSGSANRGVGEAIFGTAGLTAVTDMAGNTNQALPVIPFAAGTASTANTNPLAFVTYNSSAGIQLVLLNNATFVYQSTASSVIPSAAANLNVNLGGTNAMNTLPSSSLTVNAIGTRSAESLTGSGTLTDYSGAVVAGGTFNLSGPTLAFGTATGYFHLSPTTVATTPSFLVSDPSTITGSNGVVFSAPAVSGPTVLLPIVAFNNPTNGNGFTGGLTLNNVNAEFSTDGELGAAGQPITLGGGYLTSTNTSSAITIGRNITLGAAGGGASTATAGQVLTLSGVLSGPGSLTVDPGPAAAGGTTASTGVTALISANTYAGSTYVYFGTLSVGSDSNLGAGPVVLGTSSTFQVSTSTTLTHAINLENTYLGTATATIDTAGNNVTLSGVVSGTSALNKINGGTLTLTGNDANLSGGITVSAGGLRVNNTIGSPAVIVRAGATLGGSASVPGTIDVFGTITAGASNTAIGTFRSGGTQTWEGGGGLLTKVSADGTASDLLVMSGLTLAANSSSPFAITVTSPGTPTLATGGYVVLAVDTDAGSSNPFNSSSTAFNLSALGTPSVTGLQSATGSFAVATQLDTTSNGGYDLILVAAPEPTSLLLAALATAPLVLGRRRRSRSATRLGNAASVWTGGSVWAMNARHG